MSSEASETELGGKRTYWVKTFKWRNPELTAWLQTIDLLPLTNKQGTVLTKYLNWRKRELSHRHSTSTLVPKKLPRSYYSQDWLQKEGVYMRLSIKEVGTVPTHPTPEHTGRL